MHQNIDDMTKHPMNFRAARVRIMTKVFLEKYAHHTNEKKLVLTQHTQHNLS